LNLPNNKQAVLVLIQSSCFKLFKLDTDKLSLYTNWFGRNVFTVLIKVIPYQFYAFLAIATAPILIILGKDYGTMKQA
jgi:hypothetical protein